MASCSNVDIPLTLCSIKEYDVFVHFMDSLRWVSINIISILLHAIEERSLDIGSGILDCYRPDGTGDERYPFWLSLFNEAFYKMGGCYVHQSGDEGRSYTSVTFQSEGSCDKCMNKGRYVVLSFFTRYLHS